MGTSLLVASLFGVLIGAIASWRRGGWLENLLMRITDVVLIIPFLPLAVVLAAFLGPSVWPTAAVIAAVIWARPGPTSSSPRIRSTPTTTSTPTAARR